MIEASSIILCKSFIYFYFSISLKFRYCYRHILIINPQLSNHNLKIFTTTLFNVITFNLFLQVFCYQREVVKYLCNLEISL